MFEVERKYKVRRRDFATIQAKLFKRLVPAVPLLQEDSYLRTDDPALTERVRRQRSYDNVVYLRTQKRKSGIACNTNQECEEQIGRECYEALVLSRQAKLYGVPLAISKQRIEFYCCHAGHEVTVCLDTVRGPDDIRLGFLVELETMVSLPAQVKPAHEALRMLAQEILPASCKREKRGYRTMLREHLEARHQRSKAKK
jgi:adenylate cyclase class IV